MPASSDTGFLLDTNVLSEVAKPRPEPRVMTWLAAVDEDRVFVSVATLAELNRGIELLDAGKKQRRLRSWLLDELVPRFEDRILPVDAGIGLLWGRVVARGQRVGRPIEAIDALLAATAELYALTLVTRNVSDFAATGVRLLDPWHER